MPLDYSGLLEKYGRAGETSQQDERFERRHPGYGELI